MSGGSSWNGHATFESNAFNICGGALVNIPPTPGMVPKGRGVIATQDIPANTIVCLFPGEETFKFPREGMYRREEWDTRKNDHSNLDREETLLPLSDYAIRVAVLDFDENEREVGYHWRYLDPMATNSEFIKLAERLDSVHMEPPGIVRLPDAWVQATKRRSKLLHAKLRAMKRIATTSLDTDLHADGTHGGYRFYATTGVLSVEPDIVLQIGNRFHYVCSFGDINDEATVLQNITLALNTEFDVGNERRREILDEIKRLKLRDDYPYMGCFVNHPYESEKANLRFIDPHEWISRVRENKMHVSPELAELVAHDMNNKDLLQRQALVSRQFIRAGSELLIKYGRAI